MKTRIAIIIFLTVSLMGAFKLKAQSFITPSGTMSRITYEKTDTLKSNKYLLADETTISYTINDCKIECDNETIAAKIIQAHDQIIKRFTRTWKKDRNGPYKHYVIYVNKEDAELLKNWAKTNL